MQTAKSNSRLRSAALFILIYAICLALALFVRPIWLLIEKLSYRIDDVLNATGIALADGELDPAGLWVIFGVPLLATFVIYYLIKKIF
ncbi:TPA: hypothetical protein MJA59_003126 [Klebsiella aerogenes]|nr:hypothetical protein [Klebsiella aerogenes]